MAVNCLLSTQRIYYKHIFLNCQRTILAILHLLEFVLGFFSCLFKPTEGTVNVYVTHGLCLFSICKVKMERRSRYVTLPWKQNFWISTNRKFTKKVNSHCFKLHRSYSISFNLSNAGEISWIESERTVFEFRKRKTNFLCCFHLLREAGAWNRPFALRGHVTSCLWKWKLYDFALKND